MSQIAIMIVFRSKKEDNPVEEPVEQQKNLAANAYSLLHNWRTPPGSQKDGTFNGDALMAWLEKIKEICHESGHLEVGLSMVGQVLIHAPPDLNGFWMHHSAAIALDAKDVKEMRDGFQTALINARGVYYFEYPASSAAGCAAARLTHAQLERKNEKFLQFIGRKQKR
jgi:hypothetical protein